MRKTTSIRKRRNQVLTKLGNAVTTFIRRRKYNENNKSSSHDTIRITAIEMKEIRKYLRWRRISGRYPPILWNVSTELPANRWRWSQQPWRTCSYGEAGQNRHNKISQKVNNNNNQHHTKWTCSTAQNEATNITTTTRLEREMNVFDVMKKQQENLSKWKNLKKACPTEPKIAERFRPRRRMNERSRLRDRNMTSTSLWPFSFFFCFVLTSFLFFLETTKWKKGYTVSFLLPFSLYSNRKRGRTDGWIMKGLTKSGGSR